MLVSLIEFGLSEFGVFEFGYEQGSSLSEGSLQATGQGNAQFDSLIINLFGTTITSGSQAAFDAQTIKLTSGETIKGFATSSFEGNALRYAVMNGNSDSDAYFNPSYVIDAALNGSGFGEFAAIYVDPETFDAKGRATVRFISGYGLTSNMKSEGTGKVTLDNFAYSSGLMISHGESSIKLNPGTWSVASMQSAGEGKATLFTLVKKNSQFESTSSGILVPKAQPVASATVKSSGNSEGKFGTQYVAIVDFNGSTTTQSSFTADLLAQAIMEAYGSSLVLIKPGSPVSEFLPPAWDLVIRPYENRGVVWR